MEDDPESKTLMDNGKARKLCDYDKMPDKNQTCAFEIKDWQNCTKEKNYGYETAAPCIFIKLNRVNILI